MVVNKKKTPAPTTETETESEQYYLTFRAGELFLRPSLTNPGFAGIMDPNRIILDRRLP